MLLNTSRAVRLAWYKEALILEHQLHIVLTGDSIRSFFYERSLDKWSESHQIAEDLFNDEQKTRKLCKELIKQVRSLKGRSIGVVLHVADEFATAELKPELDNPTLLSDLRETIYDNPHEVLEDSSIPIDQASWRLIPYPAAGASAIGTTISISRRLETFVTTLRDYGYEQNFPVITHTLSAPLVVILGLPNMIRQATDKPFVVVLQFPWFTTMAFFNEHSDLRLIRSIQHRGQPCPSNFGSSLATTNASLEFVDPDIYVLPMGERVSSYTSEGLKRSFPNSNIETYQFSEVEPLPVWMPEPFLSVQEIPEEDQEGLSHTFGVLRSERWSLQDFLPRSQESQSLFPTRNEMRLLRFFRIFKVALLIGTGLWISYMAFEVFRVTQRPEWSFEESSRTSVEQRMNMLNQERIRMEHWDVLLADRSKAWTAMEVVSMIFHEKSGIRLKTFNHSALPDTAPGQAKIGFTKEWSITGLARDEAMGYLNAINTREGIAVQFSEIAEVTGNSAYDPSPTTRSLVVNMKVQENSGFKQLPLEEIYDSNEATYPFKFNLTITQRFESTDPLAIPSTKAP